MTSQTPPPNEPDFQIQDVAQILQAIATVLKSTADLAGDSLINWLYPTISSSTELLGRTVGPIGNLPFIQYATGVPGVRWILAALGQVNTGKVHEEVADLRRRYPLESSEQLAQRIIGETAWRAAQVGFVTNVIPPIAAFFFAVDVAAITALQAEMIYKIAGVFGFEADDDTRRGEVLAIWALSSSSSSVVKSGLSLFEVLPGVGTAIAVTSDAAILYTIGFLALRYYDVKKNRIAPL
jgi:uncharacterized protein (DUF697 family)